MAKLSILTYLQAYEDFNPSNSPNRSNFKWNRNINSLEVGNPTSLQLTLAPGEVRTIFNGQRTLTQDGTTQYTISLAPFTTTTYRLSWVGGTQPTFRTLRTTGANNSTGVSVTTNATVVTFTSTAGTMFDLIAGGVVVGDYVLIGSQFSASNQGIWQIIAVTNTSFSIVNASGVVEGPINLGAGYANQVRIFSAAGVQVDDTLIISGGFSPVTQGAYVVTQVTDSYLQFSSVGALPLEGPIVTQAIAVYFLAKRLVYMESDQHITMTINGLTGDEIDPIVGPTPCAGSIDPGIFLRTSTMYSLSITNVSINPANVFFASVE